MVKKLKRVTKVAALLQREMPLFMSVETAGACVERLVALAGISYEKAATVVCAFIPCHVTPALSIRMALKLLNVLEDQETKGDPDVYIKKVQGYTKKDELRCVLTVLVMGGVEAGEEFVVDCSLNLAMFLLSKAVGRGSKGVVSPLELTGMYLQATFLTDPLTGDVRFKDISSSPENRRHNKQLHKNRLAKRCKHTDQECYLCDKNLSECANACN